MENILFSNLSLSNLSVSTREQDETGGYNLDYNVLNETIAPVSPTGNNDIYLARTVAPILTKALTEVF